MGFGYCPFCKTTFEGEHKGLFEIIFGAHLTQCAKDGFSKPLKNKEEMSFI